MNCKETRSRSVIPGKIPIAMLHIWYSRHVCPVVSHELLELEINEEQTHSNDRVKKHLEIRDPHNREYLQ